MRFCNLTRGSEIGANSYFLEHGNDRVMLDAGMHPKQVGLAATPDFGQVPHGKLDAIIVTHAHHDHIGALPVAQSRHENTPVLMTEPTGEVGSAMLHNSVNVMTRQREEKNILEYPLFTHSELDEIRAQWLYRDVGRPVEIPGTNLQAEFYDAGHIIGSTGVMVRQNGNSLFYTGDVNFDAQTLEREANFPKEGVDVMLVETTRGTYERPADYSRKSEKERLAAVITDTHEAMGSVLIPVFALGKTQELLLMMHELRQEGLIPNMPVFIGGLGTKITVLYDHYSARTRRSYSGFRLLSDIDILVAPRKRRTELVYQQRAIYLLSSGMMTENTTSNQFAWKFIDNPRNTVAFVGYTDPDSPGFALRTAKQGQAIKLAADRPPVDLHSRVETFDFSAHSSRESIADYVELVKPKKVLLVHGEEPSQEWFKARFNERIPETEVIRPMPGQPVDLW